jgi:hypothetical protein
MQLAADHQVGRCVSTSKCDTTPSRSIE